MSLGNLGGSELGILLLSFANLLLILLLAAVLGWLYLRPAAGKSNAEAEPAAADSPEAQAEAAAEQSNGLLLSDMLADLNQHCIEPLDQALSDSLQLVSSMDGLQAEQYPQWQHEHGGELQALLDQRAELEFQIDDLKSKLDRAHKLVTTLHGQNRKLGGAEKKLSHLQVQQQHLQEEMAQLRNAREESARLLKKSQRELRESRQELLDERDRRQHESSEQERLRLMLQQEAELLRKQLERERDVLARTLVEKDFIETAFIGADAATDELRQIKQEYAKLQQQLATRAKS